jgi:hypothetical protein
VGPEGGRGLTWFLGSPDGCAASKQEAEKGCLTGIHSKYSYSGERQACRRPPTYTQSSTPPPSPNSMHMLGWPGTLCLAFETIRTTSHIPATPTPYTQTHTESLPSMTKATKATKTAPVGLAWYSMLGSYRLFLQMAHVSVQMAQDHMATAFHFLISKRLPPLAPCWCVEGGGRGGEAGRG